VILYGTCNPVAQLQTRQHFIMFVYSELVNGDKISFNFQATAFMTSTVTLDTT
jgi:hypothetical protein